MDNNEFEIDINETENYEECKIQLPLNFLIFGEIENDDVKVYIKQNVYNELEKFAASNTSKELGSILLGDYSTEYGKKHIIISDYIEAKFTDASASTLTFTHETWDYIHKEHERKYAGKKIIGWQHTHPSYGIFLSNYDMFIQENFFNMPFQIAYVIDPVQNLRGFFQWKNGRIEKLKGYYIYDDIGKKIKMETPKVEKNTSGNRSNKILYSLYAVLCVLLLIMLGVIYNINKKYDDMMKKQNVTLNEINIALDKQQAEINQQSEVINEQKDMLDSQQNTINSQQEKINSQQEVIDLHQTELESQSNAIEKQQGDINTLREYFEEGIIDTTDNITVDDLIDRIENVDAEIENQKLVIDELKEFVEAFEEKGEAVEFAIYNVKQGDTLVSICNDFGIDYYSNYKFILSINGILDADKIFADEKLLLPIIKAE